VSVDQPSAAKVYGASSAPVSVRSRAFTVQHALYAADAGALVCAALIAVIFSAQDGRSAALAIILAACVLWWTCAQLTGLYNRDLDRIGYSTVDEIAAIAAILTFAIWLPVMVGSVSGASVHLNVVGLFWATGIAGLLVARSAARTIVGRNRDHSQRAVVVGAGDVGQLIARKLVQHPEYGIEFAGFVDAAPKRIRGDIGAAPILGAVSDLPEIIEAGGVDRVLVAFSNDGANELLPVLQALPRTIHVDVVPRLFDALAPGFQHHAVEGFPLVGLPVSRRTRAALFAKRLIDVVGAVLLLLMLAPLFVVVALLIKCDSPGPVLFRQTRLGMGMHRFPMLKFRTMKLGTDEAKHLEYVRSVMDKRAAPEGNNLYKLDRSDSLTSVGRRLRTLSIDELPQLVNVLRGEMSLVGPRPCLPDEVEFFAPHHFDRFAAPAGVTGLWQVTARAHSTFEEELDLDVAYVRSWSLPLDLRLLLRTPAAVFRKDATA
jgi:exopolysaccharide biosynthesis polyprenyl glycosylphosphotransferase